MNTMPNEIKIPYTQAPRTFKPGMKVVNTQDRRMVGEVLASIHGVSGDFYWVHFLAFAAPQTIVGENLELAPLPTVSVFIDETTRKRLMEGKPVHVELYPKGSDGFLYGPVGSERVEIELSDDEPEAPSVVRFHTDESKGEQ